jgi:hypothetical protein
VKSTWLLQGTLLLALGGCYNTPIDRYYAEHSPAPLQIPVPESEDCADCYEDSLTGGQIFTMYCSYCHNARSLAERPFSSYKNAAAHMRVRANLTGKEYAKLVAWMRRWQNVPAPVQPLEPGPKRFIFSQPIAELREEGKAAAPAAKAEALPDQPAPAVGALPAGPP